MAFKTVETWEVERSFLPAMNLDRLPSLPSEMPYRNHLLKTLSGGFSILFNGLFFYFLITAAFNRAYDEGQVQTNSDKNTITVIELGNSLADSPEPESAAGGGNGQPAPASQIPSDIDTTIETELPAEWSVGRIRVPRAIAVTPGTDIVNGNSSGFDDGGSKGGGVYDPFAGAAPNRKPEEELARRSGKPKQPSLVEQVTGFFGFGMGEEGIDPSAFEQLVEGLKRRLPRAKGSVELTVVVDSEGMVLSAEIIGGTASAQVKFFVRNAVVGKQLASRRWSQQDGVKLPAINFG
ncbi:hypothetical protein [Parasphingorhabdus sp.]|uniref:hypothetical protein n=1 Tax=Parasphingorhabdus sp. TaxID=2709688 RepID=UPI003265ED49